jgi:phosphoglycolate phosphatase
VQDIRGIVFDKDGTLFDFHRTWAAFNARLIADLAGGDSVRATALADALGFDLEAPRFLPDSPMIAGTMDVVIDAVARVLPELDGALVARRVSDGSHDIVPVEAVPLAPLLDGLIREGLILGVATNDSEAPARAHLGSLGVLDRFAFVAGYDSGHGAKPGPGMLDAFCRATGLSPAACAMIGDSTHDLASGRAAGMVTVGVLTGIAEAGELAPLADVVLADIGALPGWLSMRRGTASRRA